MRLAFGSVGCQDTFLLDRPIMEILSVQGCMNISGLVVLKKCLMLVVVPVVKFNRTLNECCVLKGESKIR